MGEFEDKTEAFHRALITEKLEQCDDAQKKGFTRLFGSIDKIPKGKLRDVFNLCVRTLNK